MTETTRFVSNTTTAFIVLLAIAGWLTLMIWVNDRYSMEQQRSCMDGVVRPEVWDPQYDSKMLEFTSDVRGCMRG